MDKIAKDVGDIQSRLLDHRPIINAEVRYFVREFEVYKVKKPKVHPKGTYHLQQKTLFKLLQTALL